MATVATKDLKRGMIVVVGRYGEKIVILSDALANADGTVSYRSRNPGASDAAALLTISGRPNKEFRLAGWSRRAA